MAVGTASDDNQPGPSGVMENGNPRPHRRDRQEAATPRCNAPSASSGRSYVPSYLLSGISRPPNGYNTARLFQRRLHVQNELDLESS